MGDGIEHNFRVAGIFDKSYKDLLGKMRREELKPLAATFAGNCDRVFQLQAALINTAFNMIWLARVDRSIRINRGIALDDVAADQNPAYSEDIKSALGELITARSQPDYDWEEQWNVGAASISHLSSNGLMMDTGIMALMASMVIDGWMCFESLALDLWVEMVNRFPDPLARNVLAGKPAPEGDVSQKDQRSINMDVFVEYGFDLSSHMGDLLLGQRKVSFASVKTVVAAYKTTFRNDYTEDLIPSDPLRRLESLRNLYAHRGGKVDLGFMRNWRGVPTVHPLEVGQNYVVTGEIVQEYMDAVVKSGCDLILFADRWFDDHAGGTGSQQELGLT